MPVSQPMTTVIPATPPCAAPAGPHDTIRAARISLIRLPLPRPISDAKVLAGRQKPLTDVALVVAQLRTRDGLEGLGFSYALRTGGPALYELVREIAPLLIGERSDDIPALWDKLAWALASIGQSGLAMHAIAPFDIALWDIRARRANQPLSRHLGARRDSIPVYNTSGGYLSTPLDQVLDNIDASLAAGIGGIKIKVGQPDLDEDVRRLSAIKARLGDTVPLMVDANQQWDRAAALRASQRLAPFGLTWIEEPLNAYDHQGYAELAAASAAPLSTGEMLSSLREHEALLNRCPIAFLQPDAARIGGVTPFLRVMDLAARRGLGLAPHFVMEIHVHLAAAYPHDNTPWIEHFDWLRPVFNEGPDIREGRIRVPALPGLGLGLSEQAARWTIAQSDCRQPP
ncbi:mandelate racemase/muconate lactonizing enzyme family protein [uncultured Castellaniella sp.]|uniref:L-talarate/galactarate dehydratase n=1 Tax=uncultured Castellaniella sp. TaxID=647907 RepID=UPI00261D9915|nr:mandelate racemase/muconate lactonizing enzyme family protein [uncultured Castellaniella sp.]